MTKELENAILKIIEPLKDLRAEVELHQEAFEKEGFPEEYDPKTYTGGYVRGCAQFNADHAKWKYKTNLRFIFNDAVQELFRMTFGLKSIGWYQYTAYYDDCFYFDKAVYMGTRCINTPEYRYGRGSGGTADQHKAVDWFFAKFTEQDFLILFGDHVMVFLTPDGAIIRPYDDGEQLEYYAKGAVG